MPLLFMTCTSFRTVKYITRNEATQAKGFQPATLFNKEFNKEVRLWRASIR